MKRPGLSPRFFSATLFLSGAGALAAAAPDAKPATPAPASPGPMMAAKRPTNDELLKRFDKNGDGRIDEDERAAAREQMLQRQMEMQAARAAALPGGAEAFRARLLEMFDRNHDGRLDDEERAEAQKYAAEHGFAPGAAWREELMKRFDKNGNGRLDDDERAAVREFVATQFAAKSTASAPAPSDSDAEKKRLDAIAAEMARRREAGRAASPQPGK